MASSSYVLGQYNNLAGPVGDNTFMKLMLNADCGRCRLIPESVTVGPSIFKDECLRMKVNESSNEEIFVTNGYYYFHGKIRLLENVQNFSVKLINVDPNSASQQDDYLLFTRAGTDEQYIKTISIPGGLDPDRTESENWIDVSFCFVPLMNFNCLTFELQRDRSDDYINIRYPKIIYEEVSKVNNIITSEIGDGANLIKIGVQSRPGFLMNINGEEIRTNRSGIYELKNGLVLVSSFSAIAPAKVSEVDIIDAENTIKTNYESGQDGPERTASISLVDTAASERTRYVDGFTLDYLYKGE